MSRPSARRLLAALLLPLLAGAAGCWEQWSNEWFPQMRWQKAVQAFEPVEHDGRVAAFRPPEGAVPVDARPAPVGRLDFAAMDALENPVDATFKSVARGQELYRSHCETCHGARGNGDGPVSAAGEIQGPFSGVFPVHTASGRSDGFIFNVIRIGAGDAAGYRMPAYGSRMTEREIWHTVNYVRYLQQGGEP